MEHIFVINPMSGRKDSTKFITDFLKENYSHLNYTIYNTKGVGDAINYVKQKCENKKAPITFYACGGDGTINEVVNGAFGYEDVYVSAYPCGSGNDFVKVFGKENHFNDLHKIINGEPRKIDLLKFNDRLTVNMVNLGFDASVAFNMNKFKKWPLISGKGAYNLGIVYSLLFKMKQKVVIEVDDELVFDGKILLSAIGNGLCCGGAYYCLPKASIDDGLMDAVIVKKLSRFKFIGLIKKYKSGEYVDIPKYQKYIKYLKCKKIVLKSEKDITYSLDGECGQIKELIITIISKCINFVVPKEYTK